MKTRPIVKYAFRGLLLLVAAIMTLWAVAAIYYSNIPGQFLKVAGAVIFAVAGCSFFVVVRPFRRAYLAFLVLFAVVLVWWLLIPASNNRNWQKDVATLASVDIQGDKLIVHNIRNCDYRTETDFDVAYYDRTYDLSKLRGADLYICSWGPPLIAHTMMTFCFNDDNYLCVSIETRKEVGEQYSAVKGFFKQFELIYIVGDERDLVRLRTNLRGENVHLYRLAAKPELVREVLMDYVKSINGLVKQPAWYNAVTDNCTTAIRSHISPYTHGKMSWKVLANGFLDSLLYERKAVDTSIPFEKLKELSNIDERAKSAGNSPDFSALIRVGVPDPRK
jgi:hypothetical protein